MAQKKENKLERSIADLAGALDFYKRSGGDEPAAFLAVSKALEVGVEYSWKELKRRLEEKGLVDIYTPKDVVRKAAQAGMLDDAENWLNYIDARNDSVHDYYGMTQAEYVELARKFLKDIKKVFVR